MLIDAMAHLNDPRIQDSLELILKRARDAGVSHIINAGVNPCRDLPVPPSHVPQVATAYGIHPMAVGQEPLEEQIVALQRRLVEDNAVAIGEIGLDKRPQMPDFALQIQAFKAQLNLARDMELPVIIHCVQSTGALLSELKNQGTLAAGGIWHGFTGSPELMKQIIRQNLHISIGGQVTNPQSKKCRQSAAQIPLNRLLIESDTPDHPPESWSESQSEPAAIQKVAEEIAELRGESIQVIQEKTNQNATRLFGLE